MAKNLVIVESPSKSKTIEKYLGKILEKDDALYCYVDKKKCRRRRFFLDIMCLGIKECDQ